MGATILTGKCAAAFRSNDGELRYVLFGRRYEKNCYPHTPSWSAFAFGTREEVLRRAFVGASDCCGGMLQSPAGEIKPENYIESWKQEINRAVQMNDVAVKLEFGSEWRAPLPASAREQVREALERAGFADRFAAIKAGGITTTLFRDANLLRTIYGAGGELAPWRVFNQWEVGTVPIDTRAVRNVRVPSEELPAVRCYAVDQNIRLVAGEDGKWLDGQWAYSALARFVTGIVLERELNHPGYAKAAIPLLREALNDAPPLPPQTRITVRRARAEKDYQQRDVDELARSLGLVGEGEQAPEEFTFEFSDIGGDDAGRVRYRIGSMRDVLTWDVPTPLVEQAAAVVATTQGELTFA